VEAVGQPGPLGQQLAPVVDQHTQFLQRPLGADGWQVVVAQGDPGDQQRVDRVGLGVVTPPAASLGGQLRWHLDNGEAAARQHERGLAAQAAGSFDPDPGGLLVQRPGEQVGVPGRVVGEGGVVDWPAALIDRAGCKGVFVRVDPDVVHLILLSAWGGRQALRTRAWIHKGSLLSSDIARQGSLGGSSSGKATARSWARRCLVTPRDLDRSPTRTSCCSASTAGLTSGMVALVQRARSH
jgi:hypothetical protein